MEQSRCAARNLIALLIASPVLCFAQITAIEFDSTEIQRGIETLTVTVRARNPVGVPITYYVAGAASTAGTSGWYGFQPSRQAMTVPPASTNSVQLTWSPSIGASSGVYTFSAALYRTSDGTDTYDTELITEAFSVIDPLSGMIGDVSFDPAECQAGVQTITASIPVANTGGTTITYYVSAAARGVGESGWHYFSPARLEVNLVNGESDRVQLTWTPLANASKGSYEFACSLYRTATGTDTYDTLIIPDAFTVVDPVAGEVESAGFTPQVAMPGFETVTARVIIRNPADIAITYYVDAATSAPGQPGNYYFTPRREPVLLAPGSSAELDFSWSPHASMPLGNYSFACTLYRTATGTDIYADYYLAEAFSLGDPFAGRASVRFMLLPADATEAGAAWRIDGGTWNANGTTVFDLLPGIHHVEFTAPLGWNAPEPLRVDLSENESYTDSIEFIPGQGQTASLTFVQTGSLLTLRWDDDGTSLLESTDRLGPDARWNTVSGVTIDQGQKVYSGAPDAPRRFFRLRTP